MSNPYNENDVVEIGIPEPNEDLTKAVENALNYAGQKDREFQKQIAQALDIVNKARHSQETAQEYMQKSQKTNQKERAIRQSAKVNAIKKRERIKTIAITAVLGISLVLGAAGVYSVNEAYQAAKQAQTISPVTPTTYRNYETDVWGYTEDGFRDTARDLLSNERNNNLDIGAFYHNIAHPNYNMNFLFNELYSILSNPLNGYSQEVINDLCYPDFESYLNAHGFDNTNDYSKATKKILAAIYKHGENSKDFERLMAKYFPNEMEETEGYGER